MSEPLPLVVGLGVVDPGLVAEVFAGRCRFVADPTESDLREAQGAIARADADIDTAFLDRTPRLRVVARTGVGVERVDLDAATARGIAVVVTPGSGAVAVAEGAIAMAMHLVKRFGRLTDLVRSGRWADRGSVAVGDLAGSTLGVVGFGRIGQHAGTLGAALGMKVLAYDPVAEPPAAYRCQHARGAAVPERRHHPAPAAHPGHPPPDRRRDAGGDQARGHPGQLRPRIADRQRRCLPGAARPVGSPASGWTSSTPSRRSTTRCSTTRTSSSPPT